MVPTFQAVNQLKRWGFLKPAAGWTAKERRGRIAYSSYWGRASYLHCDPVTGFQFPRFTSSPSTPSPPCHHFTQRPVCDRCIQKAGEGVADVTSSWSLEAKHFIAGPVGSSSIQATAAIREFCSAVFFCSFLRFAFILFIKHHMHQRHHHRFHALRFCMFCTQTVFFLALPIHLQLYLPVMFIHCSLPVPVLLFISMLRIRALFNQFIHYCNWGIVQGRE